MNVLLLHDNKEIRGMMAFAIEAEAGTVVHRLEDMQAAFTHLLDEKPVDLLICQDDESSVKLFKYLLSVDSTVPVILIQQPGAGFSGASAFPDLKVVGRVLASDPVEKVNEIIKAARQAIKSAHDATGDEYCRINTELLLKVIPLQGDIYIRLSSIKFIKLFKKGDTFNAADLARYLTQKKIDYLYLKRDNCPEFIAKFKTALAAIVQQKTVGLTEVFDVAAKVQESIIDLGRTFGFTPEIQEVVRQNVNLVISTIQGNTKLSFLLSQLQKGGESYVSRHSVVLAHLACALSTKMAWHSASTFEKLSYAALMHDVVLESDKLAAIDTKEELKAKITELTKDEHDQVLNHPILASERLRDFAALPADVDTILSQHHERPDGTGFPRGLAGGRIAPLSALFIISHDIVTAYLREGLGPREFATKYKDRYNAGTFRKIMDTLVADEEMLETAS
jgi:HD-GYP domain-containing protein (c-di-GMP phosphodiesterase class II)